ncbi:MAG: Rne/Rng family ribonuclease [Bacteroidota bacterium]
MANELLVNVTDEKTRIVLLKQGKVVEYHQEEKDLAYKVGDIYLGSIKMVEPSLNAAFVDIGYGKDAFLAYSDIGLQAPSLQKFVHKVTQQKKALNLKDFTLLPPLKKDEKIDNILSKKSRMLVRIIKEPIGHKPFRISSSISLPGRYLVLFPGGNDIRFSKKIRSLKEKRRLRTLLEAIKPKNFSVVVRKEAEEKEVAVLDRDLKQLVSTWEKGIARLKDAKPGDKIIGELKRAPSILRDALNEKFDKIIIDEPRRYEEIKEYVQSIDPEKIKIVSQYSGKTPILEHFDIEKQLKRLLGKIVPLDGGGHLVIQETEAMWVIDVNSGSRTGPGINQESIALQVNETAMKEISRQMSLRGMGGIIVVDCISMKNPEHKRKVYQSIKQHLEGSRTKVNVLPLTRLGLMQITRERVRPAIKEAYSNGQKANGFISDEIEHQLNVLLTKGITVRKLKVVVHPYLYAYFSAGFFPKKWRWQWRYFRRIKLKAEKELPSVNSFRFIYLDKNKKKNVLNF